MYFKSSSEKASKVYYLGEYASGAEVDVASKFAGYASLTSANFMLEPTSTSTTGGGYSYGIYLNVWRPFGSTVTINAGASNYTVTKTYNASTGKLTVGCKSTVNSTSSTPCIVDDAERTYSGSGTFTASAKVKVYLIDGTIETL